MTSEQRVETHLTAARRPDADAAVSLLKRRQWFAEEEKPKPKPEGEPPAPPEAGAPPAKLDPLDAWVASLPDAEKPGAAALVTELRATRAEAKERRLKLEMEERKAAEAEATRLQEEADRLKKQGDYQKLAEQREQEAEALKPYKKKAEMYEAALNDMLEKRLKDVQPHIRELLQGKNPLESMAWLEANAEKLKLPTAPVLDGGATGDGKKPPPDKKEVLGGNRGTRY